MTLLEDDPAWVEMMDEPPPEPEPDVEMPPGYDDIIATPPPEEP